MTSARSSLKQGVIDVTPPKSAFARFFPKLSERLELRSVRKALDEFEKACHRNGISIVAQEVKNGRNKTIAQIKSSLAGMDTNTLDLVCGEAERRTLDKTGFMTKEARHFVLGVVSEYLANIAPDNSDSVALFAKAGQAFMDAETFSQAMNAFSAAYAKARGPDAQYADEYRRLAVHCSRLHQADFVENVINW